MSTRSELKVRLEGQMAKVALITGASAGLGAEFARQLARRGDRLVLVARREDRLRDLADEVGNARVVALDLSAHDAAERLMADLDAAGEQVELLINNAGFGQIGRFASLDGARQRRDDRPQHRHADGPVPRRRAAE